MEENDETNKSEAQVIENIDEQITYRRWIPFVVLGVVALIAMVFVAINLGEIGEFAQQAAKAKPKWLGFAALSQLATYGCLAIVWARVLARIATPVSVFSLYSLSVAKLFADQAIPPNGVSGAVFFLHALVRRGVPHRLAFAVFVFNTAAFFTAFLIATMICFLGLVTSDNTPPALAISVAAFAGVILLVLFVILIVSLLSPTASPAWAAKIPKFEKAKEWVHTAAKHINAQRLLFFEATVLQFAIRMIDGVTLLLVFYAIGGELSYVACFFAVVTASITASIGPIPMGLGAYEAGMVTALKLFGASIEEAITVTLIFRGLSLWLPLLPGFYIIQREILGQKKSHDSPEITKIE